MGLATFKGGIHPFEGKELSMDHPITVLLPKGELVFPMSQHIGAPATPIVAVGDSVLAGQRIGEAAGFVSAHVISSVSGKVKKIEPRRVANGSMVNSVIIENDGAYKTVDGFGIDRDPKLLTKAQIRESIKDAGIVGLGGAGFPTHVKLTPKDDTKIEYVIVNGAECEPYLTSDYRLMIEEPQKLIAGLQIILQLFENAKGMIGIESNKPEAIARLKELTKEEERIEVVEVLTKYPQGGERSLIYALTGRKVNSSMLPADAGCVVDNVDTVISIYMAVAKSTPLVRRVVTITGDTIANPGNFHVKTGTNYEELIDAAGGFVMDVKKIISGGPMMGFAVFDLAIPVTKNSSALTCLSVDDVADHPESACIRCGRCIDVCPASIVPVLMKEAAYHDNMAWFEKLNGMECIECGSCAYVCPAKIPLAQSFRFMKSKVNAERRKQAQAAQEKKESVGGNKS